LIRERILPASLAMIEFLAPLELSVARNKCHVDPSLRWGDGVRIRSLGATDSRGAAKSQRRGEYFTPKVEGLSQARILLAL
jgi:hypothetical protein